jgi:hypothetical protein
VTGSQTQIYIISFNYVFTLIKTYSIVFIPIYGEKGQEASQEDILLISVGLGFSIFLLLAIFIFLVRRNKELVSETNDLPHSNESHTSFDFEFSNPSAIITSNYMRFLSETKAAET